VCDFSPPFPDDSENSKSVGTIVDNENWIVTKQQQRESCRQLVKSDETDHNQTRNSFDLKIFSSKKISQESCKHLIVIGFLSFPFPEMTQFSREWKIISIKLED
jgi:hypothetical protein